LNVNLDDDADEGLNHKDIEFSDSVDEQDEQP